MAAIPAFTVHQAMITCGLDNVTLFQGQTKAQRVATEMFSDQFETTKDKTYHDLNEDFKAFGYLSVANGKIVFMPSVKSNLKAFIQWCKDEYRMNRNPSNFVFHLDAATRTTLSTRYTTHKKYVDDSSINSSAATPKDFTADVKWVDWKPTFANYLRTLPGRDGVPIKYVIRPEVMGNPAPQTDMLNGYINMAPLHGPSYDIDNLQVLTLLTKFIVGNYDAEATVQTLNTENDGRAAFMRLQEHYEGDGLMANEITGAESTIETLFYGGEKPPNMYWDKFERELTKAYAICDRNAGRQVDPDDKKLRALQGRIKADFMSQAKTNVTSMMARRPVGVDYPTAIRIYRAEVAIKYPNGSRHASARGERQVREANRNGNQHHGGRGRGGGRNNNRGGRGRGGGRSNGRRTSGSNHPDAINITLRNGNQLRYHASHHFTSEQMNQMTEEQRNTMTTQRREYRERNNRGSDQRSHQTQLAELRSEFQQYREDMSRGTPPSDIATGASAQISQVTAGTRFGSITGGRNEQERLRRGNQS